MISKCKVNSKSKNMRLIDEQTDKPNLCVRYSIRCESVNYVSFRHDKNVSSIFECSCMDRVHASLTNVIYSVWFTISCMRV